MPMQPAEKYWNQVNNKEEDKRQYKLQCEGSTFHENTGGKRVYKYFFLQALMKYLAEYGDTVLIHDGAFSRVLCTIDHDLLEYLYSSTEHIDKANQYIYLKKWLGEGLLTSTGSKWRAHRKIITNSFHFTILKGFVTVFEVVGDNLIKKLSNEVGKGSVEISKPISFYALDVICESAMGIKINALQNENLDYIKNIKTICKIIVSRMFSPIHTILYPLTWNFYKEKNALRGIHSYVEDVIDKKILEKQNNLTNKETMMMESKSNENLNRKKTMAFLDLLLEAKILDQPLSKEEIRDEVNTFMFEGHDTTSSAITFSLLMLATHPEVQEKVLQEQLQIFNCDLKNAKPSFTRLGEMKYLELVIKETLRLFPSVPFFGRLLTKDTEFNGIWYPKGLAVMLFPYGAHRSPKYFSEPEKFKPERFENQKLPFSYTPFSAGPRNCIGQKFAMLEMLSVISKVIRHFEIGPATPEHKIQLAAETILISKNGVRISIKRR